MDTFSSVTIPDTLNRKPEMAIMEISRSRLMSKNKIACGLSDIKLKVKRPCLKDILKNNIR